MNHDYRDTVFLPKTDFAMRANLPKREPAMLERWAELDVWRRCQEAAADRPAFVLHDGPPYANGHLHMGTAMNKVLKDVISRARHMAGRRSCYVPGWDCHGLPIEWQIEQNYRKKGKDKDAVPIVEFRKECREFAAKWIDVQREEFRRLGVSGDWERPYTTMAFEAEAGIYRELGKFLLNGQLYRGKKSVMWSPVEKTALAEAEVEYHDVASPAIMVAMPIVRASAPALDGASAVIWTTTPWTIPANRAIAYGEDVDYLVIDARSVGDGGEIAQGARLLVAEPLLETLLRDAEITDHTVLARMKGRMLAGSIAHHPLRGLAGGYGFESPLLAGDFVTTDQGTGLVHVAPSHGADDFELGLAHGIEAADTVAENGQYTELVPGFVGTHVYKAAEPVIDALRDRGALVARGEIRHSYPHSWRSKAPLIFRATAQWFIPMDRPIGDGGETLRDRALASIDATRFVPAKGRNRLRSMIETRPDWCISRQRAWGVPIAVFVDKRTGEPLRDPEVVERIARAFEEEGADAWWSRDPAEFLGADRDPASFEKVEDILDVWFDSGSTHATVLERRPELKWPADLYLEGSDQHRGWFHSSLLEACGTRGRAPYDAVLTHGFVLDGQGRKMSKSLGNTILPEELLKSHGADILRLWTVNADYVEDVRISKEIMAGQAEAYRRLRNTLRYLLGALNGFSADERIELAEMPPLDRWAMHRLWEMDRLVRDADAAFDYQRLAGALHHFCAVDLSSFYFDVRKDSLYCDAPDDPRRRAARTVMDAVFERLVRWLAPVLVFTADEAYLARHGEEAGSVHVETWLDAPEAWRDDALAERFSKVIALRRVITGALEIERREKRIGSSLQASPRVSLANDADAAAIDGLDLAELAITSAIEIVRGPGPESGFRLDDVPGVAVEPRLAEGEKCARCWRVSPEVDPERALCRRCAGVLAVR